MPSGDITEQQVEHARRMWRAGHRDTAIARDCGLTRYKARKLMSAFEQTEPRPKIEGVGPNERPDVEEILRRVQMDYRRREELEHRRKAQSITFDGGPIAIVFAGDEHFGNDGTDVQRVFDEAYMIRDTPGMYTWRTGDVVDNFILGRMRQIRDGNRISIPDEWTLAVELLNVIRPKLLAWCGGNHPYWSEVASGVSVEESILPEGILWDKDEIVADVHVADASVRIRQRHQWLGRSQWNPTHALEKAFRMDRSDADIHVGSHTHIASLVRDSLGPNAERKVAILTGTYKVWDEHARRKGFPEHDVSTTATLIVNEDGSFMATSNLEAAVNYMEAVYN